MNTMDLNIVHIASDILTEFLEVAIHCLIYSREVYPRGVFVRKQKYNIPIQVCIHPEVADYISKLILSLQPVIEECAAEKVVFVLFNKQRVPLEKFVFEIEQQNREFLKEDAYLTQLEQSLRAFVFKLNICDSYLKEKPTEEVSWTVQVYCRKSSHQNMLKSFCYQDFVWIEADESEVKFNDPKITLIKALESGPLKMQLYIEEKDAVF